MKKNKCERIIETKGNYAVLIHVQEDYIFAYFLINAGNGIQDAQVADQWSGSTLGGAKRWAAKQLKDC